MSSVRVLDRNAPWPGLSSFREEDAAYFRGRSREIAEVHRLIRRETLTVLYGRSGLGKTSLLSAGIHPLFRAERLLPVRVRLDFVPAAPPLVQQVLEALHGAAEDAGLRTEPLDAKLTLWERFHRIGNELWDATNRLVTPVIVLDQFEEIFTKGQDRRDDVAHLLDELADAVGQAIPDEIRKRLETGTEDPDAFELERRGVRFVVTLREDFLPELESAWRARSIRDARYRLEAMTPAAAREVVEVGSHLIAPGDEDAIVRFVAGSSGTIEPALLSVVLDELNAKRPPGGLITAALLTGSQSEILTNFYDRSVGDLGPDVRRFVEEQLLTSDGDRDSQALERAQKSGVSSAALEKLIDRRIVRIERAGRVPRVELTHDLLTGVIRRSRDERRRQEESENLARTRRALLRTRIVAAVFLLIIIGAGIAGWIAYRQSQLAAFHRRQTSQQQVAFAAARINSEQTEEALATLAVAMRLDPENDLARMLTLRLLLGRAWPRVVKEQQTPPISQMVVSADATRVMVRARGELLVFDTATRGLRCRAPIDKDFRLAPTAGGGRFAGVSGTRLVIGDSNTCRTTTLEHGYDKGPAITMARDGNLIVTAENRRVRNWRAQDGSLLRETRLTGIPSETVTLLSAGQERVVQRDGSYRVTLSPRGTLVAVALNGTVTILDSATLRKIGKTITLDPELGWGSKECEPIVSPDDTRVVTCSATDAQFWNVRNGERHVPSLGHDFPVVSIGYDPKGQFLLTTSRSGARLFYSVDSLKPASEAPLYIPGLNTFFLGAQRSPSAAFDREGRRIVTASSLGTRVWDRVARPLTETFRHDARAIASRFLDPTGDVVTAYDDGHLVFWTARRAFEDELRLPKGTVSFRVSGGRIFSVAGRTLTIGDLNTGETRTTTLAKPCEWLGNVSEDGTLLLCSSPDLTVFDTGSGADLGPHHPLGDEDEAGLSPDGHSILVLKGSDESAEIVVYDRAPFRVRWRLTDPAALRTIRFNRDWSRAVLTLDNGIARILDWRTGRQLAMEDRRTNKQEVGYALLDHAGKRVVYTVESNTGLDKRTVLWDLTTNSKTEIRDALSFDSIAFSANDKYVVSTTGDQTVQVWRTDTGSPVGLPSSHREWVNSVGLSADGSKVFTVDEWEQLRVWDVGTGALLDSMTRRYDASKSLTHPPGFTVDDRFLPFDAMMQNIQFRTGTKEDAAVLADLAEAIGGKRVSEDGAVVEVAGAERRIAGIAARVRGDGVAAKVARWFAADPVTRPVSPFTTQTPEQYIRAALATGDPTIREELPMRFPGHPLLAGTP